MQSAEHGWRHDFSRVPVGTRATGALKIAQGGQEPGEDRKGATSDDSQSTWRPLGLRLQRACACDGECSSCKSKKRKGLQARTAISSPADVYEEEAERTAREVMKTPDADAVRTAPVRIHSLTNSVPMDVDPVPSSVQSALAQSGRPLEAELRRDMEYRFGHDFSNVRVHSGQESDQSSRDVNALAYTVGSNIVFGSGQYAPRTREGRSLIAHELTHVVQQGNSPALSSQAIIQRQPAKPDAAKPADECHIRNARAYIYFEIARRFKNANDDDPEVVKRAHCLKVAFRQLTAQDAVEFAQQIMNRNGIYKDYETLATPTRVAIAQILVDIVNRQTTESYLARLLFTGAVLPDYDAKSPKPAIVAARDESGKLLQITLDKNVLAVAAASVLGSSECDKFTFGFTQFSTDDYLVVDYYDSKLDKYLTLDYGSKIKPFLPCQDVFNKGDVWSYSAKLDCGAKEATKQINDNVPLAFSDTPSNAVILFQDQATMFPTGVSWVNKFVTVFSVMLPNGVVHHLSWFSWSMEYCETFPANAVGKALVGNRIFNPAGRNVTINPIQNGAPSLPLVSRIGKPAAKPCNEIIHVTLDKDDFLFHDSPIVKC